MAVTDSVFHSTTASDYATGQQKEWHIVIVMTNLSIVFLSNLIKRSK